MDNELLWPNATQRIPHWRPKKKKQDGRNRRRETLNRLWLNRREKKLPPKEIRKQSRRWRDSRSRMNLFQKEKKKRVSKVATVSHLPPQTKTHIPLIGPHCRTHFITKRFFCFLSIEGLFRGRLLQNVLTNMLYYVVIKRLGLLKCCVCVRPSLSLSLFLEESNVYLHTATPH